ncbi:MAG: hypothetical protein KAI72_07845, partial [Candidatus Pacebacteria bacterium]|nr:hypothetical protein [Candidatus Paceibacterota bacterium]
DLNESSGSGWNCAAPYNKGGDLRGAVPQPLAPWGTWELKTVRMLAKDRIEKKIIVMALKKTKGNRAEAARLLGISDRSIFYKIDGLGISVAACQQENLDKVPDNFSYNLQKNYMLFVEQAEKAVIIAALRWTKGNIIRAAQLLEVENKTLHVLIKRYGIVASDYRTSNVLEGISKKTPGMVPPEIRKELLELGINLTSKEGVRPINLRDVRQEAIVEVEKLLIEMALIKDAVNRKKAAESLKISYNTLLHKIALLGINVDLCKAGDSTEIPDDYDFDLKKAVYKAVARAESKAIWCALLMSDWNKNKAAEFLSISRRTLNNKMDEYGITDKVEKIAEDEVIAQSVGEGREKKREGEKKTVSVSRLRQDLLMGIDRNKKRLRKMIGGSTAAIFNWLGPNISFSDEDFELSPDSAAFLLGGKDVSPEEVQRLLWETILMLERYPEKHKGLSYTEYHAENYDKQEKEPSWEGKEA